jgi:hypothetical protein
MKHTCEYCGIVGEVLEGEEPHPRLEDCIQALKQALKQERDNNKQLIEALVIYTNVRLMGGEYARAN